MQAIAVPEHEHTFVMTGKVEVRNGFDKMVQLQIETCTFKYCVAGGIGMDNNLVNSNDSMFFRRLLLVSEKLITLVNQREIVDDPDPAVVKVGHD